jgi:hypothetical protein
MLRPSPERRSQTNFVECFYLVAVVVYENPLLRG